MTKYIFGCLQFLVEHKANVTFYRPFPKDFSWEAHDIFEGQTAQSLRGSGKGWRMVDDRWERPV